jgi:large subunit ribosomal protein L6
MSRVGNKLIKLPGGASVKIAADHLEVKGPKGTMTCPVPAGIRFELQDGELTARRERDQDAALHGLARSLAQNAVEGVTNGFKKELDIIGTGYRAAVNGRVASFSVGYSHPIEVLMPAGVDITIDKQTHVVVSGIDKQAVGQTAANIRALRPPDPYKNKGIRYMDEVLLKKAGKTGAK